MVSSGLSARVPVSSQVRLGDASCGVSGPSADFGRRDEWFTRGHGRSLFLTVRARPYVASTVRANIRIQARVFTHLTMKGVLGAMDLGVDQ
jgi:hypothetical protein